LSPSAGVVDLAVTSQPRNPEGDLWDTSRLLDWASGARYLLVDETFREFAETRSVVRTGRPGLFATGSFTKFYGGDDLRLGFVAVPEELIDEFGRFYGVVTNELAPFSVAGAAKALDLRPKLRSVVRTVLRTNRAALRRRWARVPAPRAPLVFDRPETGENGDSLALRAVRASVLVCSGSFFGDPRGVRICLTRRSFPEDLDAYLRVRDGPKAA